MYLLEQYFNLNLFKKNLTFYNKTYNFISNISNITYSL